MSSSWSLRMLLASSVAGVGLAAQSSSCWRSGQFETLVTFGDSYTDENRLGYFINNNGSAPPIGWDGGVGFATASGGLSWARYAAIYSSATLYNYAVSGAVCSNQVTPRLFAAIKAPFPDIDGYELPAFIADSNYTTANGTKFFTGTPDNTVYAIWIGTNDLGNDAFLTDSQIKGKTVADYMDCVYGQISRLYANGGRYFVIMNLAPLNLLPQYALPEDGGLPATQFFPTKQGMNATAINGRMHETVAALNQVYEYRTPYEVTFNQTWDDINVASFDVNSLMTDIYHNPARHLNGTAPPNVQGVVKLCDAQTSANCTLADSPDSYEWYDPLHPSEQTSRVIAREFVNVIAGNSTYATYWG